MPNKNTTIYYHPPFLLPHPLLSHTEQLCRTEWEQKIITWKTEEKKRKTKKKRKTEHNKSYFEF